MPVHAQVTGFDSLFVGREETLNELRSYLHDSASKPPIISLWGQAGIGKSLILQRFSEICEEKRIICARIECRAKYTPLNILEYLSEELRRKGLALPRFAESYNIYQSIQAQVADLDRQQSNSQIDTIASISGGTVSLITGLLPGSSQLIGEQAGNVIEKIVQTMGKSKKIDANLYLNPFETLTTIFLDDLADIEHRHRLKNLFFSRQQPIVLIIDGRESLSGYSDWLRNFSVRCPKHIFIVLSGISPINSLVSRRGFTDFQSRLKEIKVPLMEEKDIRKLVTKFVDVRHTHAIIPPETVDDIVKTANGIPFIAVLKTEEVMRRNAVDRHNPSVELSKWAEALGPELYELVVSASALRWFTHELLNVVADKSISDELFQELINLSIVTYTKDGHTIHNVVRDIIASSLDDSELDSFKRIHKRAQDYFRHRIAALENESPYKTDLIHRIEVECLYHAFLVSENVGLTSFKQAFVKHFHVTRQFNLCYALLNEVDRLETSDRTKAWKHYFSVVLQQNQDENFHPLRERLELLLKEYITDPDLEFSIREYLGTLYWYYDPLPGGQEKAEIQYRQALEIATRNQAHLDGRVRINCLLGQLHQRREGQGIPFLEEALNAYDALDQLKGYSVDPVLRASIWKEIAGTYRLQGRFKESEHLLLQSVEIFSNADRPFDEGHARRELGMVYTHLGKLLDANQQLNHAQKCFSSVQGERVWERAWLDVALGDIAVNMHKYQEAEELYNDALRKRSDDNFIKAVVLGQLGDMYCRQHNWQFAIESAESSLKLRREISDKFGIGLCWLVKGYSVLGQAMEQCRGIASFSATIPAFFPGERRENELSYEQGVLTARDCFDKGKIEFKQYGSLYWEQLCIYGLGCTYYALGERDKTREIASTVFSVSKEKEYFDLAARGALLMGLVHLKDATNESSDSEIRGQTHISEEYFLQCLNLSLKYNVLLTRILARIIRASLDIRFTFYGGVVGREITMHLLTSWRETGDEEVEMKMASAYDASQSGAIGKSVATLIS